MAQMPGKYPCPTSPRRLVVMVDLHEREQIERIAELEGRGLTRTLQLLLDAGIELYRQTIEQER